MSGLVYFIEYSWIFALVYSALQNSMDGLHKMFINIQDNNVISPISFKSKGGHWIGYKLQSF